MGYNLVLALVGLLSYVSSFVLGATSFADAITFHIGWGVITAIATLLASSSSELLKDTPFEGMSNLQIVTLLAAVRSSALFPIFAYLARDDFCWKLFRWTAPCQAVMVIIGALVLNQYASASWLSVLVAVVLCALAVIFYAQIWFASSSLPIPSKTASADETSTTAAAASVTVLTKEEKVEEENENHPQEKTDANASSESTSRASSTVDGEFPITHKHEVAVAIASILGGLLGGLCGANGPPLLVCSILFNFPPAINRGMLPPTAAIIFPLRAVVSLILGEFRADAWMFYVVTVVGGCCGVFAGHYVGTRSFFKASNSSNCNKNNSNALYNSVLSILLLASAVALSHVTAAWLLIGVTVCFLMLILSYWKFR